MAHRLAVFSVLLYFFRFSWPAATLPAAPNSNTTLKPLQKVHELQSTNTTGKLDPLHLNTSFGNTKSVTFIGPIISVFTNPRISAISQMMGSHTVYPIRATFSTSLISGMIYH